MTSWQGGEKGEAGKTIFPLNFGLSKNCGKICYVRKISENFCLKVHNFVQTLILKKFMSKIKIFSTLADIYSCLSRFSVFVCLFAPSSFFHDAAGGPHLFSQEGKALSHHFPET